jgi:hypothetical protein
VSESHLPGWRWDGKRDVYEGLPEKDHEWPITLDQARSWLLGQENQLRIRQHLERYLTTYDGRFFEHFVLKSERRQFTPWDVLAAESLSVTVPARAINRLIDGQEVREAVGAILDSLMPGRDALWTCDDALLKGDKSALDKSGALFRLYYILRSRDIGIGPVTTSKQLAAKFPNVVPIRDSRVEALLDISPEGSWWIAIRELLSPQLVDHLDGLTLPDRVPYVSTLRRLDIILWMEAIARGVSSRRSVKGD